MIRTPDLLIRSGRPRRTIRLHSAYPRVIARFPQAVAPGFDKNSRIAHHRKQAAEYRHKAKHERSQFDRDHTDPLTWRREQWFRDALALHEALQAPFFIALTQTAWAALPADRDEAGDLSHYDYVRLDDREDHDRSHRLGR